jgi:hypothetical protein
VPVKDKAVRSKHRERKHSDSNVYLTSMKKDGVGIVSDCSADQHGDTISRLPMREVRNPLGSSNCHSQLLVVSSQGKPQTSHGHHGRSEGLTAEAALPQQVLSKRDLGSAAPQHHTHATKHTRSDILKQGLSWEF